MTESPVQDVVEPHDRPCHGCGQTDDHPRVRVMSIHTTADDDGLRHIDCLPDDVEVDEALAPILAARAEGKRGDELRAFIAERVANQSTTDTEAS